MVSTLTPARSASSPMVKSPRMSAPLTPYHGTEFRVNHDMFVLGVRADGTTDRKTIATRRSSRRRRRVGVLRRAACTSGARNQRRMDWKPDRTGAVPAFFYRDDAAVSR